MPSEVCLKRFTSRWLACLWLFLAASGSCYALNPSGETRVWRDQSGRFSVEARFVRVDGKAVVLQKASDGKEISVPAVRLSDADQQHIRTLLRAGAKPATQSRSTSSPAAPIKPIDLNAKIPGGVNQTTLSNFLLNQLPVPVWIDRIALGHSGVTLDSPITIAADSTLAEALDAALEPLRCCWYVRQSVIVVSSTDTEMNRLAIRWYRVRNQAAPRHFEPRLLHEIRSKVVDFKPERLADGSAGNVFAHAGPSVLLSISCDLPTQRQIAQHFHELVVPVPAAEFRSVFLNDAFYQRVGDVAANTNSPSRWLDKIAAAIDCQLEWNAEYSLTDLWPESAELPLATLDDLAIHDALTLVCQSYGLGWDFSNKRLAIYSYGREPRHNWDWQLPARWQRSPMEILNVLQSFVGPSRLERDSNHDFISYNQRTNTISFGYGLPRLLVIEQFARDTARARK